MRGAAGACAVQCSEVSQGGVACLGRASVVRRKWPKERESSLVKPSWGTSSRRSGGKARLRVRNARGRSGQEQAGAGEDAKAGADGEGSVESSRLSRAQE